MENTNGNSRSDRTRVAITGVGPVTAIGVGVDGMWAGLQRQRSPVRKITRFDSSPWRSKIAAEIDDFDAANFMDPKTARRLDRFTQFSVGIARLALEDAGLKPEELDRDRVGVQMGSALGGLSYSEAQMYEMLKNGVRAIDPRIALTTFCGAASCTVAIEFGFTGPNSTNAMSCASGTIAVGEGLRLIRDDMADIVVAGGVEAPLAPMCFGAFALIRAMSTRNEDPEQACRPFDRERDGFIMGEGACALILERWDHAKARGARIYAELLGYGTTNDAHHMAAPLPTGAQAARAMKLALRNAHISAEEIDFISPHGSSTPLNDSTESQAIKQVLGERAYQVPISGTKPYHAHALGASGAIEAAIAALSIARGWIPPTLNFVGGDENCDLDYVKGSGRAYRPSVCLSNSFGFGGINACLVMRSANGN